jgi:two-component system sensor histidine kinase HydH
MTDLLMNPETMMPKSSGAGSEHFNFAGALLDCISRGTIVISPSRQILAFDERAEKLTGLRAAEVLGRPTSVLQPLLESVISDTFSTNRPVSSRKVLLSASDGDPRLLQVNTHLAIQPGSGVLSVLIELQNVGQAQEIATNLEHLDRLANLGVLGAGFAHEIKNALVAVRTFVDLLQERSKDDELAQLVSREIMRIDAVVRQVLRDATREEFTLAPLSVHALLQDAVNLLRYQFQARSIQHTLRLDAPADRVSGDERQLRHAFLNLLMNAVEAMTGPGSIEVASAVSEGRELCVTISDTGSGIRPEHLPLLFSPFFTTKKEGTGLGLAITHRIIQKHDGRITAESKLNEGTTFKVFLPLL